MAAMVRLRVLLVTIIVLGVAASVTLWIAPSSQPAEQAVAQPTRIPTGVSLAQLAPTPTPSVAQELVPGQRLLRAIPVPGPRAEDLIILETIGTDRTLGHLIIWRTNGALKTQLFSVSLQAHPPGHLQDVDSAIISGLQQTRNGQRELGIVYDASAYGSGSPTAMFVLLRLVGDQWQIVWTATDHIPDWRSSHGRVEFPQGDLSELIVRSDSAFVRDDPLSGVLFEANAGPHRAFVDTWVRAGDSYVRTSAKTVPSAYATLVTFLYDLAQRDAAGAQALVTDATLVDRARGAGLDGAIGKNWIIACVGSVDCENTGPISFYQGPHVAISFVEQDGKWLISDIQNGPPT